METSQDDAAPLATDAPTPPQGDEGEARASSWWEVLRDNYFSFDRRTLGFTRLMLGFLLLTDLFRRQEAWWQMFSDEGVLPNHVNLQRPWQPGGFSIVNAFTTRGECWVLFFPILATFLCLFAGYKTKLAQVLTVVWVTGMNMRVSLIENGGYVVNNLLVLWTCFLPLGDRFSVDAMLASMRKKRERSAEDLNFRDDLVDPLKLDPFVSFIGMVICVQLAAIYFFNVVHKTGPAWKDGTAVHYVLYCDRMVTPYIARIRDYVPNVLILFMTKSTLTAEATIPICILSPLGRVWTKRIALALMNMLHIAFGTVFVLGPFSWSACVFSTLLVSKEDWELASRTMRRVHRARTIVFNPASGAALLACRILARMDRFELLTFEEGTAASLEVVRPEGVRLTRALAVADIVGALPVGPAIAWVLRLPGIRQAIDALIRRGEGRTSRYFGIGLPRASAAPAEPAPLLTKLGALPVLFRELAILAFFAGAVNQAMVELWVINKRIKVPQPEPLRLIAQKAHFLQGWFMFSPNPVMDDGTVVVDAVTVDGRHVDPFWAKEPNFDLIHAKSFGYDQIWSDYFNRIRDSGHTIYRDAMKDYMFRLPERTGNPNDTIVSGDVYWVQDMSPKWGEINSWKEERVKVFSFENPKARQTALRE